MGRARNTEAAVAGLANFDARLGARRGSATRQAQRDREEHEANVGSLLDALRDDADLPGAIARAHRAGIDASHPSYNDALLAVERSLESSYKARVDAVTALKRPPETVDSWTYLQNEGAMLLKAYEHEVTDHKIGLGEVADLIDVFNTLRDRDDSTRLRPLAEAVESCLLSHHYPLIDELRDKDSDDTRDSADRWVRDADDVVWAILNSLAEATDEAVVHEQAPFIATVAACVNERRLDAVQMEAVTRTAYPNAVAGTSAREAAFAPLVAALKVHKLSSVLSA